MPSSSSTDLLGRLIAFDTVSRNSNLALIEHIKTLLASHGIESTLVFDETGKKANLFASVGPKGVPGVMLSGHTDVVPVDGQTWTSDPFTMIERQGRLFGRGASDMKGFVACAVNALIAAASRPLTRPLQLALSYDEEIGCVGVRRLLDLLETTPDRPMLTIIGEPTDMRLATGHKGKTALTAVCCGMAGHSSLAPNFVNAIYLATDLIGAIRGRQDDLAAHGAHDEAYDIPYTTLHVGKIDGGRILNIVPEECRFDFEIRNLKADDPAAILEGIQSDAEKLVASAKARVPEAKPEITLNTWSAYPGLETSPTSEAVAFVEAFSPDPLARTKVAFGTEGGLFNQRIGVPVVVCGPGAIAQAHKPDEYVERHQLDACDAFLAGLIGALAA